MSNYMLSDTDTIFMRAYASAIKSKFQLDVGENYCMLISPVTQRGIAAGDLISPEITQYLIYKFADALQYSDNPSYTGGSAGSYIQQLRSYIDWVDLKRDPSQQVADMVHKLFDALTAANEKYWSVLAEALHKYHQFKEFYPGQDFWKWAPNTYLPLAAAQAALKLAQTQFYQALQRFYGPNYAALSTYMDNITHAQGSAPLPGYVLSDNINKTIENNSNSSYNQAGIVDDGLIDQAIDWANKGQMFPQQRIMESTIRVPTYSIASYIDTVQAWITASKQGAKREQIITIDTKEGRKASWEDFGFTKVHPTLRGTAGVWPIFSAKINTEDGKKTVRTLHPKGPKGADDRLDRYISLQLAMIGIAKFDIRPGEWDIPDIRTLLPDRLPDAPTVLSSNLAKMVSVLVGYDVELRLQFDTGVKDEVHNIIEEVKASGGTMSVFGFRVSVGDNGAGSVGGLEAGGLDDDVSGGGGGELRAVGLEDGAPLSGNLMGRVDTDFEDIKWDKEKGLLILTPTKGQVYPTILGAVAQRCQVE